MLISVISDINQVVHPEIPLQLCNFTVCFVFLGVQVWEDDIYIADLT